MTQPLHAVPASEPGSLESYARSYVRYLRSEGKAAGTIEKYLLAVRQLSEFLAARGHSTVAIEVQKGQLQEHMTALLAEGKSSTANTRFYSLKSFFNFLLEDEEIRWHPMDGMSPPPAPAPPVPVLETGAIDALLKTCKTASFEDRRDAALIMMLLDTGCRVTELADMELERMGDGTVQVYGKGSKWRTVHFGTTAARVLDRYLRVRDRRRDADSPYLWLGTKGKMTRSGVRSVLDRRAAKAGVEHVHAHQFRHTFAHMWLADGGQETDLMRLTGWSSRTMVGRYAASAADARAAESYRKRQSPADKLKGSK